MYPQLIFQKLVGNLQVVEQFFFTIENFERQNCTFRRAKKIVFEV